jgi:hypothetical protein
MGALAERGFPLTSIDELVRLQAPDNFAQELKVVAEVQAYFKVAYKRIIDVVPMTIENLFLEELASELRRSLVEKLGLLGKDGLEKCTNYAADSAEIEEKRSSLSKRLEVLTSSTRILYNV